MIAHVLALALVSGQAPQQTLLPGSVDLPLLAGSQIDPTCGGQVAEINPGAGLACVQGAGGGAEALRNAYAEAAVERGWRYSFIVQGVIVVERDLPSGKCESLSFNPIGRKPDDADGAASGLAIILDLNMPCVRPQ